MRPVKEAIQIRSTQIRLDLAYKVDDFHDSLPDVAGKIFHRDDIKKQAE